MVQKASSEQIAGFALKQKNELSLSPYPVAQFQNVPIHLSERIGTAASGPTGIYLHPLVHSIPESPFKQFMLGHEKHHVDSRDALKDLGYYHLENHLREYPVSLTEVRQTASEIRREQEFAADKAGVNSALAAYSSGEAEYGIREMLSVFENEEASDSHPALRERMDKISTLIKSSAGTLQPKPSSPVGLGNVFSSPIFDELAQMAKEL
jgi:hypothetical protein